MRIHFVSFATPEFRPRQWLLEWSARHLGKADVIHTWNPRRLDTNGFMAKHADLFPGSVGFGWYAWKPYVIRKTLDSAADGDLVIYQDVGRRAMMLATHSFAFWNAYLEKTGKTCLPGVEIPEWGPNRKWTKKCAFEILDLFSDTYLECPQIQASWSVWRKAPETTAFIVEWASACENLDLVGGQLPSGRQAEHQDFIEHRWDQSLLTLLSRKHQLIPLAYPAPLPPNFQDKSCDYWMELLNAAPGNTVLRTCGKAAATIYHACETTTKAFNRGLLPPPRI